MIEAVAPTDTEVKRVELRVCRDVHQDDDPFACFRATAGVGIILAQKASSLKVCRGDGDQVRSWPIYLKLMAGTAKAIKYAVFRLGRLRDAFVTEQ
jgi:hypothetical protein